MKRSSRSLMIFPLLIVLWGTIIASPFRYFANITRDIGTFTLGRMGLDNDFAVPMSYLFAIAVMTALFFVRRSAVRNLVPAICSVLSAAFFLMRESFPADLPMVIASGLILTIIASSFRSPLPEEWLTDLFMLSLPTMIVYDTLVIPLLSLLDINSMMFNPWIKIQSSSAFMNIELPLMPIILWGIVFTLAAVVPAVFFVTARLGKR